MMFKLALQAFVSAAFLRVHLFTDPLLRVQCRVDLLARRNKVMRTAEIAYAGVVTLFCTILPFVYIPH
jgi:hypothetical protein